MGEDKAKSELKNRGTDILKGAYNLKTPQDNRDYYQRFAMAYDQDFARELGYIYPSAIAKLFLDMTEFPSGRLCDIGCGTGLVATHIKALRPDIQIDGIDISPEMLAIAAGKSLYENLFEIDLTRDISSLPTDYAAFVSAGTFTHGHLGTEPLQKLIRHCERGAAFCIGVNQHHYDSHGFASFFDDLVFKDLITQPDIAHINIYAQQDSKYNNRFALICRFTVLG